jgi:hypothetical protein
MKTKLKDLDDKYEVYFDGSILNTKTNKNVVFTPDEKGYMKARLYSPLSKNADGRKPYRLHRLIAKAFLTDYSDDLQVNHKNGIKDDNRVENLEMVTASQNVYHAWNNLDSSKRKQKLNNRRDEYGRFK